LQGNEHDQPSSTTNKAGTNEPHSTKHKLDQLNVPRSLCTTHKLVTGTTLSGLGFIKALEIKFMIN
jgi:hypothetical protein